MHSGIMLTKQSNRTLLNGRNWFKLLQKEGQTRKPTFDAKTNRYSCMSTATFSQPIQLLPAKTIDGKKPTREQVPKGASLCEYCTAKCCRYFALPIDAPTCEQDLDFIRWYLLHDRATVFIEDGTWYLLVHTDCKHLQSDHRCGIYYTRPQICRDYSTANCEFDEDAVYEMYFETSEQVAEYMEARFHSSDAKTLRSPEPSLLPIL